MTYLVMLAFVAILGSLAMALVFMMRGGGSSAAQPNQPSQPNRRMAKALAWRIGLSVLLFAAILFSHWMGWIQPTGIAPGR